MDRGFTDIFSKDSFIPLVPIKALRSFLLAGSLTLELCGRGSHNKMGINFSLLRKATQKNPRSLIKTLAMCNFCYHDNSNKLNAIVFVFSRHSLLPNSHCFSCCCLALIKGIDFRISQAGWQPIDHLLI